MYSRTEASQARQAFWTTFGQYMAPQHSAEGERINWINYKTGQKDIYFKMQAGTSIATIGIELTHTDLELQQLYFEQFEQSKKILHNTLKEEWAWHLHVPSDSGKMISKIYTVYENVNIMKREDWPTAISFFKPRMIALDAYWSEVKYGFEALR
jgi:hypothetical protein